MYLKDRRPVVLNHNPFMSFHPASSPELHNQVRLYRVMVLPAVYLWSNLSIGDRLTPHVVYVAC